MKEYGIKGIPNLLVLKRNGTTAILNARSDVEEEGAMCIEKWM